MLMYINEAAKLTGATKKAIEYYCQKGLLDPAISENGYKFFSAEDVEKLKKISLLRSLGVSVANIAELVNKGDSLAFWKIIDTQRRDLQRRKEQNDLLKELASSLDWNAVKLKAAAAECRESVIDRLMIAFPGFWGNYLSLHFREFLMNPIETEEQENAYHEICDYLDSVHMEIPDELEDYVDSLNTLDSQEIFLNTRNALSDVIDDPENWLVNHKEIIERYLKFQDTEEYRNSDGAKLKEVLKRFNQEQGYNSVFIPAMRKLSPAYDEYVLKLQKADQAFSQRYQQ